MLPKKYATIRIGLLALLLTTLTACSGMESAFAPDPKLKNNSSTPTASSSETQPPQTQGQLPDAFPADIPRYPTAQFLAAEPGLTAAQGITRWQSNDPSNAIATFYQQQFQSGGWQIVTPFPTEGGNAENVLVARQNDLEVKISIASSSPTEFAIAYQRNNNAANSPTDNPTPTQLASDTPLEFSDLDRIAEPWRGYVQDLAALGVLISNQNQGDRFNPDAIITRREYARWLVAANNKLFANQPGKQLRLAANNSQPVFQDVPKNDPDFAAIQGLAEAGFIASTLTGDNSAMLFRPDAPLTREDLIAWKVALDRRKALPSASIDQIKQTWGFQDATKIDPKALRSLYADYQNSGQANISRVFGSTTLFQPKKNVTRAEAAAALWYFGFQGDGISARDALQIQTQQTANQNQNQ
ncbi:hypothetical protein NIES593_12140 [Hydrococcus rivularis NIES-593]|uniref:SLH domain-containing protein n=1 Tax=Hydrococcus rivularis NIES-593 TaxID=1921803 RepID=A0A1U7HG37_9CYAN|nr:S-layer homology domain-containing protein [Hydrococcus rivularis]OKH22540.1 hypothetical protein NIES593_12140 [Hydrococcus rivularis NIES-593]